MKSFFSPIYKRDLISLLPRSTIEELRLVSRSYNRVVELMNPARLPRTKLHSLLVGVYDEAEAFFDVDGFYRDVRPQRCWSKLAEFKYCCVDEIKILSHFLVGQLVLINESPYNAFHLDLTVREKGRSIRLSVANRLTEKAAFALLHMLSHIDGAVFESLIIDVVDAGLINPQLLEALNHLNCEGAAFQLRAVKLTSPEEPEFGPVPVMPAVLETAMQMARFGTISSVVLPDGLEIAMGIVPLCGEVGCKTLEFIVHPLLRNVDFIDQLVALFERIDLGLVPVKALDIKLHDFIPIPNAESWPRRCPAMNAYRQEDMPLDEYFARHIKKATDYYYRFENEPSGRTFQVKLKEVEGYQMHVREDKTGVDIADEMTIHFAGGFDLTIL